MAVTAGGGLADLYNDRIKQLAARVVDARVEAGESPAPHVQPVSLTLDNPLCGDEVGVTAWMEEGRVKRLSVSVRGCLLCEAATVAMVKLARDTPVASLPARTAALEAFLTGGSDLPDAWARELACFAPLQGFAGRRGCVLLPFQALSAAYQGAV